MDIIKKIINKKNKALGLTKSFYAPSRKAHRANDDTFKCKMKSIIDNYKDSLRPKDSTIDYCNKVINNNKIAWNNFTNRFSYCLDKAADIATLSHLRKESVLGVDITPNCIYLCKIDALNGKRVLTSLTSVCMEGKFVAEDIANNPAEYADSLQSLVKDNNIEEKNVAISMPVSSSIVRNITIPKMDDAEIQKALKFGSLSSNFMNPDQNLEDYSIFYQVTRRNNKSDTMDVLFVATKLSDISLYTDIVKQSGLNPVVVDVRCFAISNAFNYAQSRDKNTHQSPTAFIEFGSEESYIMIIDKEEAHIYDVPLLYSDRLALVDADINIDAINAFSERYATQARAIISEHEDRYNTESINNVVILSSVPALQEIIQCFSISMPEHVVCEGNFFNCMTIPDNLTVSSESAALPFASWGAVIGIALRKINIFGKQKQSFGQYDLNLLPNAHKYESQKRMRYLLNTLSGVASMACIWFAVTTYDQLSMVSADLSEQLSQLEEVQPKYELALVEHGDLRYVTEGGNHISNLIANVRSNQNKLLLVHRYLNLVILDNVWLKELKFSSPNKLEIVGGSTQDNSIIEFIDLLNEGSQFSKVSLRGMKEVRESYVRDASVSYVKNFKIDGLISDVDPSGSNMMAGDVYPGS